MKVIIAGSCTSNDYEFLKKKINELNLEITEVVCGGARGVDSLGQRYAEELGIPVKMFPAQWDLYGKAAGMIRNKEMGKYADYLIAFWDGKSKGTLNMINFMEQINKHGTVVRYQ